MYDDTARAVVRRWIEIKRLVYEDGSVNIIWADHSRGRMIADYYPAPNTPGLMAGDTQWKEYAKCVWRDGTTIQVYRTIQSL